MSRQRVLCPLKLYQGGAVLLGYINHRQNESPIVVDFSLIISIISRIIAYRYATTTRDASTSHDDGTFTLRNV
jgi:hypothetical protein